MLGEGAGKERGDRIDGIKLLSPFNFALTNPM